MEKKVGKIEGKEEKLTKTNQTYVKFTIGGSFYNVFDAEIINGFAVGDMVEYQLEKNKQGYDQLMSMDYATQTITTPQEAPAKEFHLTIEQSRSNALSSAITWCVTGEIRKKEVMMKLAKEFEEYILNGLDESVKD